MKKLILAAAVASATVNTAMAQTPSAAEMWEIIQQQQSKIEQQQQELENLKSEASQRDEKLDITEERLDQTADAVDQVAAGESDQWFKKTSLGGYAEMHYNNWDNQGDSGDAKDKKEIDFHRFVLFIGHEFNDRTRFFSELELEHSLAGDGKPGEIELEQAYIEHDYLERHRFKAGLFLIPVGLLNETHEPDTFYGVERNNVEKNIIPTTWWAGGIGFTGEFARGFSYDADFHSGLYLDAADGEFKIRDGRQKVAKARAETWAGTGRLKYTGVRGLELGITGQYQQDLYQDTLPDHVPATLVEAHIAYQVSGLGLRALAARWDIDDTINTIMEGADVQQGWYIEPAWRINEHWGIFGRYAFWDNQAGSDSGAAQDSGIAETHIGVNYWLLPNVVFKLDIQDQTPEKRGATELDGFNLGVGWSF
jgi:hypothetical protein